MRINIFIGLSMLMLVSCTKMPSNSLRLAYKSAWNGYSIEEVAQEMSAMTEWHEIGCVNWSDYSYKPSVQFAIAYNDTYIFVHYKVTEDGVYAQNIEDMTPIWHDDCVEFFCKKANDEHYFNFETNCLGALYSCSQIGPIQDGRRELTDEEIASVVRYASLPKEAINTSESTTWTLTIGVPFALLNIDPQHLPDYILGNFYKCGDDTPTPHYLSWQPISTPSPQFHCPEYFGKLYFTKK